MPLQRYRIRIYFHNTELLPHETTLTGLDLESGYGARDAHEHVHDLMMRIAKVARLKDRDIQYCRAVVVDSEGKEVCYFYPPHD